MMAIVTRVTLRAEGVHQWDRVMYARLEVAREKPGWVWAQLLQDCAAESTWFEVVENAE